MRYFILLALLASSACATGTDYQRAVSVHNVFRQVVLDVDSAYAPVYASAQKAADAEFPSDPLAYGKAMQVFDSALNALTAAKQAEQAMHLVLEQWQATAGKQGVLDETYACAADAVDKLTLAFGQLPKGSAFYTAAFAVSTQLRSMAGTVACPVSK